MKNQSHLDRLNLRSDEVQDILERMPSGILRYGNIAVLSVLLLVLMLSFLISYPDIIIAQGVLSTSVPSQKVYAQSSGPLEYLQVKDGEKVTKGSLLTVIHNAANYKDVLLLQSIIDTVQYDKNSFSFSPDTLPILFLGDLESDFAAFENAYSDYQLNKKFNPSEYEIMSNRSQGIQLEAQLENLLSRKRILKEELKFGKIELERARELYDKGVIASADLEEKQLAYFQQKRSLQNLEMLVPELENKINNTNNAKGGITYNRTKTQTQLQKRMLQTFANLKKAVYDYQRRYLTFSQMDGVLGFNQHWEEGMQIQKDQMLMSIFPENYGKFIVNLKVPEFNTGKLKRGQKTLISLNNYPQAEFGVVEGKVQSIALTPDANGSYYVQIALPDQLTTSHGQYLDLRREVGVSAEIITEEVSLINRFLYQFDDLFSRS